MTKDELKAYNDTLLPDNMVGEISANRMRNVMNTNVDTLDALAKGHGDSTVEAHNLNADSHPSLVQALNSLTTKIDEGLAARYTKEEISAIVSQLLRAEFIPDGETLPLVGEANVIYLIKDNTSTSALNRYIEWIWSVDKWERFGEMTSEIDLSGFYTSEQADAMLTALENSLRATIASLPVRYVVPSEVLALSDSATHEQIVAAFGGDMTAFTDALLNSAPIVLLEGDNRITVLDYSYNGSTEVRLVALADDADIIAIE